MDPLPPLLLPGDYPSIRVSPVASDAVEQCHLDYYEDIYTLSYSKQSSVHNFHY